MALVEMKSLKSELFSCGNHDDCCFFIDPDFPCKPNRNGVYFPHKSLCNKYIWCVQGQEVIQHCPLGTQYFKDGQCTFEEDKFHCSKAA